MFTILMLVLLQWHVLTAHFIAASRGDFASVGLLLFVFVTLDTVPSRPLSLEMNARESL